MLKKCKRLAIFVIISTIIFSQIEGLIKVYASDMEENEVLEERGNSLFDDEQILKNEEDDSLDEEQISRENDEKLLRQNEEVLETDSKSDVSNDTNTLRENNTDLLEDHENNNFNYNNEDTKSSENNISEKKKITVNGFDILIEKNHKDNNKFDVTVLNPPLKDYAFKELKLPSIEEIKEELEVNELKINELIVGDNFSEDINYIYELVIPKGYTIIGSNAFSRTNLSGTLELPNVRIVKDSAFSYNYNLNKINLPDAEIIKDHAFSNNQYLEEINLPKVKEIGEQAFIYNNIKEVDLPQVEIIRDGAFYYNTLEEINLPIVEIIEKDAFRYNEIRKVDLPTVKTIGEQAFSYNSIKELYLSEIEKIDNFAFVHQIKLYEISGYNDYDGIEKIYINSPNNVYDLKFEDKALRGFSDKLKNKYYGYIPIFNDNDNDKNKIIKENKIIVNPDDSPELFKFIEQSIKSELEQLHEPNSIKYIKNKENKPIDINNDKLYYIHKNIYENIYEDDINFEPLNGFYKRYSIEEFMDNYYMNYNAKYIYYYDHILLDKLIWHAKELGIENYEELIYLITFNPELLELSNQNEYIYINTENFDKYIKSDKLTEDLIKNIKEDNREYTSGSYYVHVRPYDPIFIIDNPPTILPITLRNSNVYESTISDNLVLNSEKSIKKIHNLTDFNLSYFDIINSLYLPGQPKDIIKYNPNLPKPSTPSGSGGGPSYKPSSDPKKDEVNTIEVIKIQKDKKDKKLNIYDHIQYIQGYDDNTIRPANFITREEVAAVFFRLLDDEYRENIRNNSVDYSDVSNDRWSVKHIGTLSNGDILKGYPGNKFKPTSTITRAEVATIASRFDDLETSNSSMFSDVKGHWAEKYIDSAETKGWIKGYEDGTFKPDNPITRAEFVTLVNNVLNRKVNKENIIKGINTFKDLDKKQWYYEAIVEASNSHEYEEQRLEDDSEVWTKIIHPNIEM